MCALFLFDSCQCQDDSLAGVHGQMFIVCPDGKDCDTYDFGEVPVGVEKKATFTIENRGDHKLLRFEGDLSK